MGWWTQDGEDLSDHFHGEFFTDGSCLKPGARCWQRAEWSAVKVDSSGDL